jgi:hypothetical protein
VRPLTHHSAANLVRRIRRHRLRSGPVIELRDAWFLPGPPRPGTEK